MKHFGTFLHPHIFSDQISAGFGTRKSNPDQLPYQIILVQQVHGDNIAFIKDIPATLNITADAIISPLHDVAVAVKTADCVPILYYDPVTELVAASHQGWKGTLLKLPQKIVESLINNGANKKNIKVCIGPAVGACCYDIYGERLLTFKKTFPQYSEKIFILYKEGNKQRNGLSLLALNYLLLRKAGILPENIEYSLLCTSCNSDRFYSYNKDKNTPSMTSFIVQKSG